MNITVILLGITLVLLVYTLYYFLSPSYNTLQSSTSLSKTNAPITSIQAPTSVRYGYGVWIYVNTWDSTIQKVIFNRDKNISVYLDTTTPTLKTDITMSDGSIQNVIITDNFPIQKWVHIIVSMDAGFLDCYLDGKLVQSKKVFIPASGSTAALLPMIPPNSDTSIILGGKSSMSTPFDAYISKFVRWTDTVSPQVAWDTYMKGNGSSMLPSFASYNANVSILKNNVEQNKFSIF